MAKNYQKCERRRADAELVAHLKDEMLKCYRCAVSRLQHNDREAAQYLYGWGDSYKTLLEELFDIAPEQEIDELDSLLSILEEEL